MSTRGLAAVNGVICERSRWICGCSAIAGQGIYTRSIFSLPFRSSTSFAHSLSRYLTSTLYDAFQLVYHNWLEPRSGPLFGHISTYCLLHSSSPKWYASILPHSARFGGSNTLDLDVLFEGESVTD
ncbi:hypothetical protein R3P38DRAFT_2765318 [Favolaschia claudopus]|uniref:Uncharacterized protein n=1 Tax=Favolaschia claudopus TaxID=2862362 RepID=A0AAW0D5Z2_9AGAR